MALTNFYGRLLVYKRKVENNLRYDSDHDKLTGVRSLAKFNRDMDTYRPIGQMGGSHACHLVMMDIDHFKKINDTYGHLVGNDVLKQFTADLDAYINQQTFPCGLYRIGGEEFCLLIAGGMTDGDVLKFLREYRNQLDQLVIKSRKYQVKITLSIGTTRFLPTDNDTRTILARADRNLYAAKRAGRNQIISGNDET